MPPNLGQRAQELWEEITTQWKLRTDELYVLEAACRETDLIDRMELEQRGESLTAVGSMGQPVAAPLVAELRQHRTTFANFMKQLKLPDEEGRGAASVSDNARKAANARWNKSG
jgi:hypothetical protein